LVSADKFNDPMRTYSGLLFLLALASAVRGQAPPDDAAKKMLVVPAMETRPAVNTGTTNPPAQGTSSQAAPPAEAKPSLGKEPPVPPPGSVPTAEAEAPAGPAAPAFPLSRYAALWEKSPFQLESIAPPTESAGLAQRFVLVGIAQVDGEPLVYLRERATQQAHTVKKSAANAAGLLLVQVDDSENRLADASATIKLGTEVGTIKFDTVASAAAPPPGMPQPMRQGVPQPVRLPPQVPGMPGQLVPGQVQAGAPGAQGFPGAPNPGQVQQPGAQAPMPPPRVIRRRAIVPSAP
jgi:hypothetical protein